MHIYPFLNMIDLRSLFDKAKSENESSVFVEGDVVS
jgi:hypothetical protein